MGKQEVEANDRTIAESKRKREAALSDYSDHVQHCEKCVTWVNRLCPEGERLYAIVEGRA